MSKKSTFPALTSIPSDATIDFVSGGANYKITLADYLSSLGVTGTIKQVGDATGAPVLDQQGTASGVRTISNGPGVIAELNPWNGITLKHNFTADPTGVPILASTTALSPTVRSIIAGSGMDVSLSGDAIVLASTAVETSTKTVLVSQKSDLPTPVAGVITGLPDTDYLCVADIDLADDRIVLAERTTLRGSGFLNVTLSYSGTGDMISWANVDIQISNLRLSCPNGRVWAGVNASEVVRMQSLSIEACDRVGSFTSTVSTSIRMTFVACLDITTDGITFTGQFAAFAHQSGLMRNTAGSLYDLGTATFLFYDSTTVVADIGVGATGITGLSNSGNIAPGGKGHIASCNFLGTTPLTGLSVDDDDWYFTTNNGIADSKTSALLTMQGNTTETVISASSTDGSNAVIIAGVWDVQVQSKVAATTGGRVTYGQSTGEKLAATVTLEVSPASGGTINLSAYTAVNGVANPASKQTVEASPSSSGHINLLTLASVADGDYLEIFVENNDSSVNIDVSTAVIRVN